jgi:radical SAM protein with 4Fe4S-binding SPASM domain
MTWIWYIIAAAVLILAAILIFRGIRSFIKTGGQSACDHCPYSGSCGGHCDKKPGKT